MYILCKVDNPFLLTHPSDQADEDENPSVLLEWQWRKTHKLYLHSYEKYATLSKRALSLLISLGCLDKDFEGLCDFVTYITATLCSRMYNIKKIPKGTLNVPSGSLEVSDLRS